MAASGRRGADSVLVAALASGKTRQEAARLAGVGENTVYRRLREPAFAGQVAEARSELIAAALGRLSDSSSAAADTLRVLLDAKTPPTTRLGAARAILELSVKLRESEELERRIAELEAAVAARTGPRMVA